MLDCIRRWLRPGKPSEVALVRAALRRHRQHVEDMEAAWRASGAPCCPSCAYGSTYTEAVSKVERVEAWLHILELKRDR